jgi:hypothetical protein
MIIIIATNATHATTERSEVKKTSSGSHFLACIDRGESPN